MLARRVDASDAFAPRVAEARREEPARLVRRRREPDVRGGLLVEDAAPVRGRGDVVLAVPAAVEERRGDRLRHEDGRRLVYRVRAPEGLPEMRLVEVREPRGHVELGRLDDVRADHARVEVVGARPVAEVPRDRRIRVGPGGLGRRRALYDERRARRSNGVEERPERTDGEAVDVEVDRVPHTQPLERRQNVEAQVIRARVVHEALAPRGRMGHEARQAVVGNFGARDVELITRERRRRFFRTRRPGARFHRLRGEDDARRKRRVRFHRRQRQRQTQERRLVCRRVVRRPVDGDRRVAAGAPGDAQERRCQERPDGAWFGGSRETLGGSVRCALGDSVARDSVA